MRFRSSWLPVAAAAVLLCPGAVQAQGTPTETPITPGGAAGAPGARVPGQQGAFRAPLPIRPNEAISVLAFPFGFRAAEGAEAPASPDPNAPAPGLSAAQRDAAHALTAQVKAGFLSTPAFTVASYHPQSSLIQRARKDDILRPDMVADVVATGTGAVDVAKARNIAYRLGIQTLLVGTVDETYDAKANNLELTLEAQLIDSTSGEVLRAAAVSGAASGAPGVPLTALIEAASRDAAQKVFPAMGIQLVPLREAAPAAPTSKGSTKKAQPAKKSDSDRKAAREAEEQAKRAEEDARKQAEAVARQEERARKDAEKRGVASARGKSGEMKIAAATPSAIPVAQQTQPATPATPPPAAPAAPATPAGEVAPALNGPRPAQGTASATGDPIPYGYAVGDTKEVLPQRKRSGLRVPAWLGVAAFLTGVAFLL